MTYEDFTSYTIVDSTNIQAPSATHIDAKLYRNKNSYAYKDKDVDHFGDFTHLIDVKLVSTSTAASGCTVYALANSIGNQYAIQTGGGTEIAVYSYASSTVYQLSLIESYGGKLYGSSSYYTATRGTWYYLKIVKSGTSLTLYIYSDSARTNLLATITLTLQADHKLRYCYPCQTRNLGDTSDWQDYDIENLDLQEGGAILKEIADSLSLSDVVLRDKTLTISDSVGLADAPLKHWTPQISDSIALSDAVLRNKTFQIFDSLGLSDTILRGKQFSVSDFISLCELITVITEIIKQVTDSLSLSDIVSLNKALLVADQIRLTDNVYVNKILIISDSMALAEVVEKSVQGVVKTKVFLIMGDLAIQLTG
jgi:hypothetical protein